MRSRTKKAPIKSSVSVCLAVIMVDSTQARKKFTREYEKAMRELERVRAELREYEERHKPHFMRWLHREFGATLTELREVGSKLRVQQDLLFRIQNVSFFEGVSAKKAYDYVMQEKEEWEREEREFREERQKQHHKQENEPREEGGKTPFEDFFPGDDEGDEFFKPPPKRQRKLEEEKQLRLKEIYRMVVRKLHPDMRQELTEHQRDLWHQAQEAYGKEDVDQLEVILAMCEIEEQESTRNARLSVLQRITAMFKRSLRPLKAELKKSQKDPAWSFADKQSKEVQELGRRIQAEMEQEIAQLKDELYEIEAELNAIKSSRKRKPRVIVDPFDIFFRGL